MEENIKKAIVSLSKKQALQSKEFNELTKSLTRQESMLHSHFQLEEMIAKKNEEFFETLKENGNEINNLSKSMIKHELMLENHFVDDAKMSDHVAGIDESLKSINERLSEYNKSLETHILGVLSIREQNELIRTEIKQRDVLIESRLFEAEQPIKWFKMVGNTFKWLGIVSTSIGAVLAVLRFLGKI